MYNLYANKRGTMTLSPSKTTAYRVRINLETGFATLFDHHHSQSSDKNEVKTRLEIHKNTSLSNLTSVIICEIRKLNPLQEHEAPSKGTTRAGRGHSSNALIPYKNGGW